jgi:hypothetical protein
LFSLELLNNEAAHICQIQLFPGGGVVLRKQLIVQMDEKPLTGGIN